MSDQIATIQQGLDFLKSIGVHSEFDVSKPQEEYKAFIFILRHRRILKEAGIHYLGVFGFKKRYKIHPCKNGFVFEDFSRGVTHHIRTVNGDLRCDCDDFQRSRHCGHVDRIPAE